jgi:hypothetical protein
VVGTTAFTTLVAAAAVAAEIQLIVAAKATLPLPCPWLSWR